MAIYIAETILCAFLLTDPAAVFPLSTKCDLHVPSNLTFKVNENVTIQFNLEGDCFCSQHNTIKLNRMLDGPGDDELMCQAFIPVRNGDVAGCGCQKSQESPCTIECQHQRKIVQSDTAEWSVEVVGQQYLEKRFRVDVSYPPEITLSVGGHRDQQTATINQGARNVDITCGFRNGNPRKEMILVGPDSQTVSRSTNRSATLKKRLSVVQCADAGSYRCYAENAGLEKKVLLLVKCPPERQVNTTLDMTQHEGVTFTLVAYPVPETFVFNYHGNNTSIAGQSVPPEMFSSRCTQGQQSQFKVTCEISLLDSSDDLRGWFTLTVGNALGDVDVLFQLLPTNGPGTSGNSSEGSFTVIVIISVVLILETVVIVVLVYRTRRKKRDQPNRGAGHHSVELQGDGGRDEEHVYSELDDPRRPAADLPVRCRNRTDLPRPAVPRPINIANSLSGEHRPGIAPPPTSLNQSAGVDSAACSHYTTPTATGGTQTSSNDQSGMSDYLIPIPIIPATLEKSADGLSGMSSYLTPVAPSPMTKTSPNDRSDMSTYLTPVAPPSLTKTSPNDLSDKSTYLTPVAPSPTKKTSPNDLSDKSTYLTPVVSSPMKKTSPNDLSDK